MKINLLLALLITFLFPQSILAQTQLQPQTQPFTITKAPFSSDRFDEFSPVFYKNGIVFCTNRNPNMFLNYSSSQNKGQFKIYYIDTTGKASWRKAGLLSKNLTTRLNDGPVTFNRTFDTIYYSRNFMVEGKLQDLSGMRNKLGIFFAEFAGDKWDKIQEFRFNTEWYNMTTPYLSPDGLKLFFASDRPDGYGGSDIYYSLRKNGIWQDPVNLGPQINTKGNESYPFMNNEGELFFSSDGHDGLGGKDIFVTKQRSQGWYPPVRLDAPVNSKYDDFGIVTDQLMDEGYFSSGRGRTIDIYHFKSNLFHFWFSEPQKENQYCFSISDTGSVYVDTLSLQHEWDFGDGSKIHGSNVRYCFPGPGIYTINLDILDRRTGNLFFRKLTYDIEIFEINQPFINSSDVAVTEAIIEFDGLKSFCPGYTITGYFWDFGDGSNGIGERVSHKYTESGEFNVRLGQTLKSQTSGDIIKKVVSKKIRVLKGEQERVSYLAGVPLVKKNLTDVRKIENIRVKEHYSAETDFIKESVFQVVILSSPNRISLTGTSFRNVPAKYSVKEIFDPKAGLYSYIVDQQMSLMAAYPAYSDLIASGYKNTIVRSFVLKDPAEKELYTIRKNFGLLTDLYFDATNNLTTNAYIMLDQVVNLINKNPDIKLEISVHSDNQGVPAYNLSLSQIRAQVIVNYLINRGINSKRLTAKGYGGTRPVASNTYPTDRRLNRRVDFTIVNE
jgi:outer membrane protein OmpA-like peptidoglycan-associated protein